MAVTGVVKHYDGFLYKGLQCCKLGLSTSKILHLCLD